MRAMGFRGGNVTTPHKVAIVKHLDRIAESASLMGAVNCIVRRGNELVGENTDGKGFVQSLRGVTDPAGKKAVILGAGGAARAIGVELALAGARSLVIVNRSRDKARELAELIRTGTGTPAEAEPWKGEYDVPANADVVVNATSIGLHPDITARIPLNAETLAQGMVVADVIPNPPETRLLQEARGRGCTVLDGLGMLVNQGVIGFKYWTGIDAEPAVMRRALEAIFGT
jgi:shikimate dehydrogenase